MSNGEFEKLLVETIDESLSSLGELPKHAILFPNKIASFDHALKKIFGSGADFLEIVIVKNFEKADSIFKGLSPKEASFTEIAASINQMMEK